ncbi:MAG: energy transducer TonB [Gemmatimonadota bacterium]|nr:energy transducer TonB [Gemmatimonadota bacterium]
MPSVASVLSRSANYRFKQKYGKYFAFAVLFSCLAHVMLILGMPDTGEGIMFRQETSMESIELPPEVLIPPPPKQLAKPSVPMEAPEEIDEDITIDETTPPPPDLIPEIEVEEVKDEVQEFLSVAEVMPKLKSRPKMPKMPAYIARARVDVTTVVRFFVDEKGNVDPNRTRVHQSSGYPELDELAVTWAKQMTFHPALNRGEPVKVQMAIPIQWKSR